MTRKYGKDRSLFIWVCVCVFQTLFVFLLFSLHPSPFLRTVHNSILSSFSWFTWFYFGLCSLWPKLSACGNMCVSWEREKVQCTNELIYFSSFALWNANRTNVLNRNWSSSFLVLLSECWTWFHSFLFKRLKSRLSQVFLL